MNQRHRLLQAEARAENLVEQLGIASLPINPIEIAEQHEILCKSEKIQGFSGCLIKRGDVLLLSDMRTLRTILLPLL